jgi:hypothetical protein
MFLNAANSAAGIEKAPSAASLSVMTLIGKQRFPPPAKNFRDRRHQQAVS